MKIDYKNDFSPFFVYCHHYYKFCLLQFYFFSRKFLLDIPASFVRKYELFECAYSRMPLDGEQARVSLEHEVTLWVEDLHT